MAEPNTICGHCAEKPGRRACKGCSAIKYCSPECQQADRNWHKHLCKEYASFKTKPDVNSCLAIYLPAEERIPRFVWIQVNPTDPYSDDELGPDEVKYNEDLKVPKGDTIPGYALSEFKGLFGDQRPRTTVLVMGKMGPGEGIDHSIHIAHLESSLTLPPNNSMAALIGKNGALYFKGPLVLHAMTKASNPKHVVDLHPSDFTLAIKGLAAYIFKMRKGFPGVPGKKARGAKLTTEGTFEDVEIPRVHPIFHGKGHVSQISKLCLEKPILSWQVNTKTAPAIHLNLCIETSSDETDSDAPTFGSLPPESENGTKNILFAQEDHGFLPAFGAELMYNFCRDEVDPLVKRLLSADSKPVFPIDAVLHMWKDVLLKSRRDLESDPE